MPAGNFLVVEYDDLLVKESYWRWPSRNIDGNAIDFFMTVEGKTFNQAMQALVGPQKTFQNRSELPS